MESLSVSVMEESAGWTSILCDSLNFHPSATPDEGDDCSSLASDASSGSFRLEVSLGWEKDGSVKHDFVTENQPYKHNDDCGSCGFEGWNYGIKGRGSSVPGKRASGKEETLTRGYAERKLNSTKGAASSQYSSTEVRNRDKLTIDFSKTYPHEQYGGTNTNKRKILKWNSWIKQF